MTSRPDPATSDPDTAALSTLVRDRSLRLAIVESLTSGALAHAVGAGDGASEWFAGGIVAYMRDIKESVLGVGPHTDPCSPECAEQLAVGGRELFSSDVCVSTTGVGGPDSEDGHLPGTVYLGWATAAGHGHRLLTLSGSPEQVMAATVAAAIDLLIECGRSIPAPDDGRVRGSA